MRNSRLLVVDLDDTLVMTSIANRMAYVEAIRQTVGIDLDPICPNIRLTKHVINQIFRESKWLNSTSLIQEIKKRKDEIYPDFLPYTYVNQSVIKLIRSRVDLTPVLLTNACPLRAIQTIDFHGLGNTFALYIYNEDPIKQSKFAYLLSHVSVHPASCIIVDDDVEQLSFAISVGIPRANHIHISH